MQRGNLAIVNRKEGPAVWQFRWSEKDLHGVRVQRKRVIGTVERYRDEAAARTAIAVLLSELNSEKVRMNSRSITVAQLCDHFDQRALARGNTWRSYATKRFTKRTWPAGWSCLASASFGSLKYEPMPMILPLMQGSVSP